MHHLSAGGKVGQFDQLTLKFMDISDFCDDEIAVLLTNGLEFGGFCGHSWPLVDQFHKFVTKEVFCSE